MNVLKIFFDLVVLFLAVVSMIVGFCLFEFWSILFFDKRLHLEDKIETFFADMLYYQ